MQPSPASRPRLPARGRALRPTARLLALGWLVAAGPLHAQAPAELEEPTTGPSSPRSGLGDDDPGARPFALAVDAVRPDTVLYPPGGPRLVRLAAPGSGLTALRLSIPVAEGPAEAGAGQILQILGLDRARAAAALLGARVEGSRTPWGIAYTVVGPTEDFDYLAYILREAVAEPTPDRVELERARARAREDAERERETGRGRLTAELRATAVPRARSTTGTTASLDGITATSLRGLWARTHRRDDMTLVLVGSAPLELVLASLREIGSGAREGSTPAGEAPRAGAPARPEVLRHWYGEARVAGSVRDPHGPVIAALVSGRLRAARPPHEIEVQLWEVGEVRVLGVTGAAYPADAAGMRRRVQGILSETAAGVGREEVTPIVAALRFELLSAARTPWGLATLVGRYQDASGDPEAAYEHLLALDEVTVESVRARLREMLAVGPVRAEVRP